MGVRWPAPVDVLRRLIEVSEQLGDPVGSLIVLVGGSAMAAHGIRPESRDVDAYTPSVSDEAIEQVERELRSRFGPEFRLDITTVENIWGLVMIRDLASAPRVTEIISPSGRRHVVRALAVEDLYVLKVASGRQRDHDDLPLIAGRTSASAIIRRFDELLPGIGNRSAIPAIADALVSSLARLYRVPAAKIIEQLAVSEGVRQQLREAHQ